MPNTLHPGFSDLPKALLRYSMFYPSRILKYGEIQILLVIAEVGRDRIFNDAE